MAQQISILVFVPSIDQALKVVRVCERDYQPVVAHSLEEIPSLLSTYECWALVIDSGSARYELWKDIVSPDCCVIILGRDEAEVYQTLLTWPVHFYLDYLLEKEGQPVEPVLTQMLRKAVYFSRIKKEWAQFQQSLSLSSVNARQVFKEIVEIKRLINENYLRELEKRISLEARYVWYQKERQKIENIIRKIYSANDVSSLLGIIPDIKELLQAQGMTIYLIEESETLGRHLKPIIWDDTFVTHPETFKYVASLDAPDFASAVARYGQEVNIADLAYDKRFSVRYQVNLKSPLQNILAVPIVYESQIIGVIELYNKVFMNEVQPEGFSKEDQEILRGLSEHIGIAMTKLNLIQYDALTGLLRAEPFFDKIIQKVTSMSKRKREAGSFALVMGDVDWFKHYNDRNGHEAGNRLLQELATILKHSVRENDLICRYGGEEFLFFLSGVNSLEEACQLTERIRKSVEDHYFPFEEFQPRNNLTMSFGVTIYPRKKPPGSLTLAREDLKRLVRECDLALAEAKGKQTWRLPLSEAQSRPSDKNNVVAYSQDLEKESYLRSAAYLQEKMYREKRHFQRHYTSTILMYKESGQLKVSKTINLSLGGAKILSEKPLPPAKLLELIIVLGKKARPLRGEVIYSEKVSPDSPTFYTGLQFKELSTEDFQTLEGYFQEIQKETYN